MASYSAGAKKRATIAKCRKYCSFSQAAGVAQKEKKSIQKKHK
jgi:hypothetical protein